MNTKPSTSEEAPPSKTDMRAAVAGPSGDSRDPKDDQIAELQDKIQHLSDSRHEERFLWVLVLVVIIDMYVFTHMANWAGALVVGVLQLFGIVVLADRCGVDTVRPLIDQITGFTDRVRKRTD
jgi:hypothetical protein